MNATKRQMLNIREYQEKDQIILVEFIKTLQDFEATLENDRVKGETIARPYLNNILASCSEKRGKIFIAEYQKAIAGFGCVLVETDTNPISTIKDYGYISDLFVDPQFREKNVGRVLVEAMENYARQLGMKFMQFNTLAKNVSMQEFGKKLQYRKYELTYLKEI